jgi:hypothetical protein
MTQTDELIVERMQYLWELRVPLRYRWSLPRIEWKDLLIKNPSKVMEWEAFAGDEVLNTLIAKSKLRQEPKAC